MAMMQNAFANSSFSLLSGKIQGTIIDLLMPPLSEGELMGGIVGAAITRAVAAGFVVAGAMMLYPGVSLAMAHPWAVLWFGLMGAVMLSLLGLLASIWAEKFDHNAAVTNFVIAPLAMLSGTFYVIDRLAPAFQAVSRANPFFYVISGFRYGFLVQRYRRCRRRRDGSPWSARTQCAAGAGYLPAAEVGLEDQELSAARPRRRHQCVRLCRMR